MEKIDALEVLVALYPLHPRSMSAKTLTNHVNVARTAPHTKGEFATLLKEMEEAGYIRTKIDKFGETSVVITDAGCNVRVEAGL